MKTAEKEKKKTLVGAYRTYKDKLGKTVKGTPRKNPPFFDEVDELFSAKPCCKPKNVVNSSQIVIAEGTEDIEEESKGKVVNFAQKLPSNRSDNNNKVSKCSEPKKTILV